MHVALICSLFSMQKDTFGRLLVTSLQHRRTLRTACLLKLYTLHQCHLRVTIKIAKVIQFIGAQIFVTFLFRRWYCSAISLWLIQKLQGMLSSVTRHFWVTGGHLLCGDNRHTRVCFASSSTPTVACRSTRPTSSASTAVNDVTRCRRISSPSPTTPTATCLSVSNVIISLAALTK